MSNKTIYYKPPIPQKATLIILERNKPIRTVVLEGNMRLGREDPETYSDIKLDSSIVSRNHGDFACSEGVYYYRDNNSMNGTYINGRKLAPYNERGTRAVRLHDGDVLRIDRRTLNDPHPDAVEIVFCSYYSMTDQWNRYSLAGKREVKIGREVQDITLNDFMVSRHHATIKRNGNKYWIIDNNSTNGVSINREMIDKEQELNPYDVIHIANTILVFTGDEIVYHTTKRSGIMPNKFQYSSRSVVMSININAVNAKNVFKKNKALLRNINLDIEAGDFILVLGGAGAGKSTLIKTITGQTIQSGLELDGKILLEGMDLYKKRNLQVLKRKIGIVPQYPDYRANDTVYHTIMDSALLQLSSDYSKQEIKERVEKVIHDMMLDSIRDSKLSVISGGQRKRVQVAIKAVGDISFFTFDEPDAGLDIAGRKDQINQLTSSITRAESLDNATELQSCTKNGTAGVMISHYPDDVADKYTKVIVLAKSKKDDAGHLAYYGDVRNALSFFGVKKLSDIVLEINYEGGKGRGDEFIEKFERTRRG